jgi:hypothetical protein
MSWAILLLQDPETLHTYEDYARESSYEAEGDQLPLPKPLPTGTNIRTPTLLAKGMAVDKDLQEQDTPPCTPFDDGFTPSTTRGNTSADPTDGIHTENFFTSLYTESQETDHTNVNTNQRTPAHIRTRLHAIRDA